MSGAEDGVDRLGEYFSTNLKLAEPSSVPSSTTATPRLDPRRMPAALRKSAEFALVYGDTASALVEVVATGCPDEQGTLTMFFLYSMLMCCVSDMDQPIV